LNPRATFRKTISDFIVEEIPAFAASGEGEHLLLRIEKTNVTTNEAVARICRALGVDERAAGYAGMKDKRAIATQSISVPFDLARSPDEALHLEMEGVAVRYAMRHRHKLKPGHLKGNRFTIVLRDLPAVDVPGVIDSLEEAGRNGVPNAFGPQRFGRDGNNPERALAWLGGHTPGPKDRRERRLLFSALQSELFNRVLERRRSESTWNRPLVGDVLRKSDSGGIFLCADEKTDGERALRGEISPTGPIFGAKMRWPEGKPAMIEREILAAATGSDDPFSQHHTLGEGSRRPFVLRAVELTVEKIMAEQTALRVRFVLPKGGYATTLLGFAVCLHEENGHP
jgi:tRNA pseudouridine13 synthase